MYNMFTDFYFDLEESVSVCLLLGIPMMVTLCVSLIEILFASHMAENDY